MAFYYPVELSDRFALLDWLHTVVVAITEDAMRQEGMVLGIVC